MKSITNPSVCQATIITNSKREPFGKVAWLDGDGKLQSYTEAAVTHGTYITAEFPTIDHLVKTLLDGHYDSTSCLVYGVNPHASQGIIDSNGILGVRRTNENFPRRIGLPGVFNNDFDDQPQFDIRIPDVNELDGVMCRLFPWWGGVRRAYIPSSSSAIRLPDGSPISSKRGYRCLMLIDDSSQVARVGGEVLAGLFAAGYGKVVVNRAEVSVSRLWRTLSDPAVWRPSQPDFGFGAHLQGGLTQHREAVWFDGAPMLRASDVPLGGGLDGFKASPAGVAMFAAMDQEYGRVGAEVRGQYVAAQTAAGVAADVAERHYDAANVGGELLDNWRVYFGRNGGSATIADMMAAPDEYAGRTCCDPLEPEYRGWHLCGKIWFGDGRACISSFAHSNGEPRVFLMRRYSVEERADRLFGDAPAPLASGSLEEPSVTVPESAGEPSLSEIVDLGELVDRLARMEEIEWLPLLEDLRQGRNLSKAELKKLVKRRTIAIRAEEARQAAEMEDEEGGEGLVVMYRDTPQDTAAYFKNLFCPHMIHIQEEFLVWRDGAYVEIDETFLTARVGRWLNTVMTEFVNPLTGAPGLGRFKPKAEDIEQVVKALKVLCGLDSKVVKAPSWIEPWQFDAAKCISFPNGWLDTVTGGFFASTPNLFTRNALTFNYDPAAPLPGNFFKFLSEVWPTQEERDEFIPQLQRMMGLLLVPDISYQKIFLFLGVSGAGKGTLLRLIELLVGEANRASSSSTDVLGRFTMNSFRAKTLLTFDDYEVDPKDARQNFGILKRISGCGSVPIDRKGKSQLTETLPCRVVITANRLPEFPDPEGAMLRRYVPFRFKTSFADKPDTKLDQKLAVELPGILNWALEGLRAVRVMDQPFAPGPLAKIELELTKRSGAKLTDFIEDTLTVDAGEKVMKVSVYGAYKLWCATAGVDHPMEQSKFHQQLRSHLPTIGETRPNVKDGPKIRWYTGLKLNV